jgi:hypothetical protein
MRQLFWQNMEEVSQDMADAAFRLFDKYGCLKTKFMEHCVQRGTGVWDEELDYGPLFLIEVCLLGLPSFMRCQNLTFAIFRPLELLLTFAFS